MIIQSILISPPVFTYNFWHIYHYSHMRYSTRRTHTAFTHLITAALPTEQHRSWSCSSNSFLRRYPLPTSQLQIFNPVILKLKVTIRQAIYCTLSNKSDLLVQCKWNLRFYFRKWHRNLNSMRAQFLRALAIKITVFWDVMPWILA